MMDTKYKRKAGPESSDLEQIVAYAVSMGTTNAFLIYPSTETGLFDIPIGAVRVRGLTFNIGKEPDEAGVEFLDQLGEIITSGS